jgi:hypothetical protein
MDVYLLPYAPPRHSNLSFDTAPFASGNSLPSIPSRLPREWCSSRPSAALSFLRRTSSAERVPVLSAPNKPTFSEHQTPSQLSPARAALSKHNVKKSSPTAPPRRSRPIPNRDGSVRTHAHRENMRKPRSRTQETQPRWVPGCGFQFLRRSSSAETCRGRFWRAQGWYGRSVLRSGRRGGRRRNMNRWSALRAGVCALCGSTNHGFGTAYQQDVQHVGTVHGFCCVRWLDFFTRYRVGMISHVHMGLVRFHTFISYAGVFVVSRADISDQPWITSRKNLEKEFDWSMKVLRKLFLPSTPNFLNFIPHGKI